MSNTYSQGSSIPANLSVSLSLNALSHAKLQTTDYLVVHDSEKVSCISMQGSSVLSSKEITFEAANDDNRNFIQIAKLLLLHSKIFLVVASSKTVKVYVESHGLQEVFTYGLSSENKLGQIVHSVHSLSKSVFAVATESKVHIFAVGRGASIKVKDVQHEFKSKVRSVIHVFFSNGNGTCAVVEGLPSSGNGLITVSKFEESKSTFSEAKQIAVHLNTKATGLQLYNSLIVLVTISGQIQLISSLSGLLLCEIHAHVRCIGAFDIAPKTGLLVTVSEDSHLRVFRIEETEGDQCKVEHVFQTNVTNEMICGVKFLNAAGSKLALCTYESSQIKVFEQL